MRILILPALSLFSLFRLVVLPANIFDWKNNQVFFSAETQDTWSAWELQEKKGWLIAEIMLWSLQMSLFFQFYKEKFWSASQVLKGSGIDCYQCYFPL